MQGDVKQHVRERYGKAAEAVQESSRASCCGGDKDAISIDLYDSRQTEGLPVEAMLASLGCGNPVALAELNEGETVLDLGSGGGIDVLLSAKRVGSTGKAYGLDMTDEMLQLARANQAKAGITNVEFLKGEIESIPLPDASVDVILSNCVINLSGDKDAVFAEAIRVLRPGGRFAVADIVSRKPLPQEVTRQVEFWTGCVSGALLEEDYKARLEAAGFTDVSLQTLRTYTPEDAQGFLASHHLDPDTAGATIAQLAENVYSAFIRASKPL